MWWNKVLCFANFLLLAVSILLGNLHVAFCALDMKHGHQKKIPSLLVRCFSPCHPTSKHSVASGPLYHFMYLRSLVGIQRLLFSKTRYYKTDRGHLIRITDLCMVLVHDLVRMSFAGLMFYIAEFCTGGLPCYWNIHLRGALWKYFKDTKYPPLAFWVVEFTLIVLLYSCYASLGGHYRQWNLVKMMRQISTVQISLRLTCMPNQWIEYSSRWWLVR